ncbi:ADP-ribosylglycohydrolase family protein [Nonomuraea sp. NPDC049625]|uniref:ADP-ribosylglycohydrolase family protein n=1 Tax=Nonomuraea sp. NPDC049625 TaxID=3155775 RepID=UPI00343861D1
MELAPETLSLYRGRVRGCVLAGAIGDALGAPVEFDSIAAIRARYGDSGLTEFAAEGGGRVTDDTQLTLFTMEGLMRADIRFTHRGICHMPTVIRHAYLRWLDTQEHAAPPPARDDHVRNGWLREQRWLYSRRSPGSACLSGLRSDAWEPLEFDEFAVEGRAGPVNSGSKGCGAVMRSAPFGLLNGSARAVFESAAECARITHGHPTAYLAAGAFAMLIHSLVHGAGLREAVEVVLGRLATCAGHEETSRALRAAVALADRGQASPERVETLGGGWVAEEALAIAVYCALVEQAPAGHRGEELGAYPGITPFQRALLLAVNHSGDSDSTGAMCGNLLGARHGDAVLPGEWLVRLEGRATITELADDFAIQMTDGGAAVYCEAWFAKYPGV